MKRTVLKSFLHAADGQSVKKTVVGEEIDFDPKVVPGLEAAGLISQKKPDVKKPEPKKEVVEPKMELMPTPLPADWRTFKAPDLIALADLLGHKVDDAKSALAVIEAEQAKRTK